MNTSEDLAKRLLRNVLPVVHYSFPALTIELNDFKDLRAKIEADKKEVSKKLKRKRDLPNSFTSTHFAILTWLRFKKERQEKITYGDLFIKVQEKLSYLKVPNNKLNKKSNELIRFGLIKEAPVERDRRRKEYEITEMGLEVLSRAEERRKEFLSQVIELLGPDKFENVLPLYEQVIERVDQEILK